MQNRSQCLSSNIDGRQTDEVYNEGKTLLFEETSKTDLKSTDEER